jgi:hypothetical protein
MGDESYGFVWIQGLGTEEFEVAAVGLHGIGVLDARLPAAGTTGGRIMPGFGPEKGSS